MLIAIAWWMQAKGINYLHCLRPPILHWDLKTPNLLVDKNWAVKVCHFFLLFLEVARCALFGICLIAIPPLIGGWASCWICQMKVWGSLKMMIFTFAPIWKMQCSHWLLHLPLHSTIVALNCLMVCSMCVGLWFWIVQIQGKHFHIIEICCWNCKHLFIYLWTLSQLGSDGVLEICFL